MLDCKWPFAPTGVHERFARCGECQPCTEWRQMQWTNRMKLEAMTNPTWPIFITLTYADPQPPDSQVTLDACQRFWKRLRKKGIQSRYFLTTERGMRGTKRLHHHAIVWSPQLLSMTEKVRKQVVSSVWSHGFSDYCRQVRSAKGLGYVAKYVTKKSLGYQWSKRPMLGSLGIQEWREIVLRRHKIKPYRKGDSVPAFLHRNLLGESVKIWIPESDRMRLVKDLGVQNVPVVAPLLEGVPNGPINIEMLKGRYHGKEKIERVPGIAKYQDGNSSSTKVYEIA